VHAFLFAGANGIGKTSFAHIFAKLLLCQTKGLDQPCGRCRSCELFSAASHPDLTFIVGEGKNQAIKIDQIRELIASVNKTTHFNGYRVVIIQAVHQMNQAASNALLKTLEEPTGKSIFILLTDSLYRISATVRSRCEIIHFPTPCFAEVQPWLEANLANRAVESSGQYSTELLFRLAQESPFTALNLVENDDLAWREKLIADFSGIISGKLNPLSLSEKYQALELSQLFFWLKTLVTDLIRLKANAIARITHADQSERLQTMAAHLTAPDLYAYLDKLYAVDNQIARGMNLNHGLVVDEVFCGMLAKKRS
jgi:DNA polymerase-3 subunit delta'